MVFYQVFLLSKSQVQAVEIPKEKPKEVVKVTELGMKEKSEDFCTKYVQEFGLSRVWTSKVINCKEMHEVSHFVQYPPLSVKLGQYTTYKAKSRRSGT